MTRRAQEPGWIALTTVVWTVVALLLVLLALTAATDVLLARAQAQTAADAAALAAVSASPLVGGEGAAAQRAAAAARRNDAVLLDCRCADLMEAGVEVAVRPATPMVRRALQRVHARARAVLADRTTDAGPPGPVTTAPP